MDPVTCGSRMTWEGRGEVEVWGVELSFNVILD